MNCKSCGKWIREKKGQIGVKKCDSCIVDDALSNPDPLLASELKGGILGDIEKMREQVMELMVPKGFFPWGVALEYLREGDLLEINPSTGEVRKRRV